MIDLTKQHKPVATTAQVQSATNMARRSAERRCRQFELVV